MRVNPAGDVLMLPNLAENLLDPACQPSGIVQKMIIDATMPVPPDIRGDYGELLETPGGHGCVVAKVGSIDEEEMTRRHRALFSGSLRGAGPTRRTCEASLPLLVFGRSTGATHASTHGAPLDPEANTDPDESPVVLRLAPEIPPKLQVAPTIPPMRQTKS